MRVILLRIPFRSCGIQTLFSIICACSFAPPPLDRSDGGIVDAPPTKPSPRLELLAGHIGGPGNLDGAGAAARFNKPAGVAVDAVGNVYVADQYNGAIRKINPAGDVTTLTVTSGTRLSNPTGVTVDAAGNVYVGGFDDTIRKLTPSRVVTTLAGTADMESGDDGTGAAAHFHDPIGVAVDSAGNIVVADSLNHTIRRVSTEGVVTTLAGNAGTIGSSDGAGTAAHFNYPSGVAVDITGNIYVADTSNCTVRKISSTGVVTTLAGTAGIGGIVDGVGAAARFGAPNGIAVDGLGNVYVTDSQTIRRITPAGNVTTLAGAKDSFGSRDGTGAAARFRYPLSVAVDSAGNIYIADSGNDAIRKVTSTGTVTTLAGYATVIGSADGAVGAASFNRPSGMAADGAGNIVVADAQNHIIRKITPSGVVTTLAGAAGVAGSSDGVAISARFNQPTGVAVDDANNIYVADQGNHIIRKLTESGVITTLAGTAGLAGNIDGVGSAARFRSPSDLAADRIGDICIADRDNRIIRKLNPGGGVTTSPGPASRFRFPSGVATDGDGNTFVADRDNHVIWKITASGVVATLAGTIGIAGSGDGVGAAARFLSPTSVIADRAGNVYVADQRNTTIRKIDASGVVTTIAGVAGAAGIRLGEAPGFGAIADLVVSADSIVVSDTNAILILRHGAQQL